MFGPVDVLVNNAGIGGTRDQRFWERDDWQRVLNVNLLAVIDLTHRVIPGMVARGRGHVVNIASVAGHVGTEPLYSASKFGVRGFSVGLRRQLLGTGVHVSLVSPGFVRTEMTRDVKWSLPDASIVARAVRSVIERPRAEVIVPGYYRTLIRLERLFPAVGDVAVRVITQSRRE